MNDDTMNLSDWIRLSLLPAITMPQAARPAAFLPNPKNGETSVFLHGAAPFEELKSIAQAEVGVDRSIHGAAIVKAGVVREVTLEVRAKEPPPRHADIIGWPSAEDDPDLAKAEQRKVGAEVPPFGLH